MNIILEIAQKITEKQIKLRKELLTEHQDINAYIAETKKQLDALGVALVKETLEMADEVLQQSPARKRAWYVQRRADNRRLITEFGEVHYNRTYYKHKTEKRYSYLSDEALGIDKYVRMSVGVHSQLIQSALDVSYEKSSKAILKDVGLSKQSMLNSIRRLGEVEADDMQETPMQKRHSKRLYIEADEDHVALQKGGAKQTKLIYVHEGKQVISAGRYALKNVHYITGDYGDSETLWLKVAQYIDRVYEQSAIRRFS